MNSQVTASPPPPSNGVELGKTQNVVPPPRSQVPPTTSTNPRKTLNFEAGRGKESGDPSLQGGGPSPLPTPSSPPSKANQPGMLNGANQERPRIPQISLDAGHLARQPRPRPVGSGPLGRPAQAESKKEKQSPTGGPEVPDPGRPHSWRLVLPSQGALTTPVHRSCQGNQNLGPASQRHLSSWTLEKGCQQKQE